MNKSLQILNLFLEEDKYKVSNKILKDFNIKKEFDYINKMLFDNTVPMPPILGYMENRKMLGVVQSDIINRKLVTTSLLISNSYDLTIQQFRSVLAHECIHLIQNEKQMIYKNSKVAHGSFFISKKDELNNKIKALGLESEINPIVATEDPAEISTFSDDRFKKPVGFFVIHQDDKKLIMVVDLNVMITMKNEIINVINKNYKDHTIEFLQSDNSILKKYKLVTKLTSYSIYGLSDSDYLSLKNDSKEIDDNDVNNIKLKKPVGVIILKKSEDAYSIGIYDLQGMIDNIEVYPELFKIAHKNFEVYFLKSDDMLLSTYKVVKKDFKKPVMYLYSKDKFDKLLPNSEIIKHVVV